MFAPSVNCIYSIIRTLFKVFRSFIFNTINTLAKFLFILFNHLFSSYISIIWIITWFVLMPKLCHYLPFEQKIQKWYLLWKNLKIIFLGGLGVEITQNNQKYAKTRLLPTFWAKNSKMEFFVEKYKFNFSGGWGLKETKTTKIMPKLGHCLPFEKK